MKKILTKFRRFVFSGYFSGFENADTVIRYAPIVDNILSSNISVPSILEIGSGAQGIAPYLPFCITGVDLSFDGEVHPNLDPVWQSGTEIPFADETFDYVLSVDMLEHFPAEIRMEVVHEMFRVARRKVILAVPCGVAAERQDRILNEKYFKSRGIYYSYLQEHVVNGLPEESEMYSIIRAAAGNRVNVKIAILKNFNLRLRYLLMRLWVNETYYAPYLLLSFLFCLIKNRVSYGSCYRTIFIIDLNEDSI